MKITAKQFEKNLARLKAQQGQKITSLDIVFKDSYTPAQKAVFFDSNARRRIVRKGRRLGFTRGAAMFVIESMAQGLFKKILWGDTINQNIHNYVERYFKPALRKLPKSSWEWNKTGKVLMINGCICDFRSADNPENWEGFGYDLVILNEAGIILKNRYLWENAVFPMLLDNPDSIAIVGGTPKGKGLFYELYQRAQSDISGVWQGFAFSTYDNPHLKSEAIDELIAELGGSENIVRQEVYGDFIDTSMNELIPYGVIFNAMTPAGCTSKEAEIWGIDVARHGADQSVIARRRGLHIYEIKKPDISDLMLLADFINEQYKSLSVQDRPVQINVEVNGMGVGLYDRLTQLGLPVCYCDVASKATTEKIYNARSEMYWNLKEAFKNGLLIPQDKRLLMELAVQQYEIDDGGVFKLTPKHKIKEELGYSPDSADACALTFFPGAPLVDYAKVYEMWFGGFNGYI